MSASSERGTFRFWYRGEPAPMNGADANLGTFKYWYRGLPYPAKPAISVTPASITPATVTKTAQALQGVPGSIAASVTPATVTKTAQALQGVAGVTAASIAPATRTKTAQTVQGVAGAIAASITPATVTKTAQALQGVPGALAGSITTATVTKTPRFALQGVAGPTAADIAVATVTKTAQTVQGSNLATVSVQPALRQRSPLPLQGIVGPTTADVGAALLTKYAQLVQGVAGATAADISPATVERVATFVQGVSLAERLMSAFMLDHLQRSIFEALKAYQPMIDLDWPILDFVDEKQKPPYIAIDGETATDASCKDTQGHTTELMLDLWADYRGYKQLKEGMAAVYDALNYTKLPIPGTNKYVEGRISYMQTVRDPDGVKRHGVMRVAFITYQDLPVL